MCSKSFKDFHLNLLKWKLTLWYFQQIIPQSQTKPCYRKWSLTIIFFTLKATCASSMLSFFYLNKYILYHVTVSKNNNKTLTFVYHTSEPICFFCFVDNWYIILISILNGSKTILLFTVFATFTTHYCIFRSINI